MTGEFEAGIAFSPDDLRWIFADLEEIDIRPMAAQDQDSPFFAESFLLTALFRRPRTPAP